MLLYPGYAISHLGTIKKQACLQINFATINIHALYNMMICHHSPDEEKERIGPKQTTKRREDSIHPPRAPPKHKAPPPVSKPPMHRSMPPLPPPPAPVNVVVPSGMPVLAMPVRAPMMPQQGIMVRPMMGGPRE